MFRVHMLPAEDGDCFLVEVGEATDYCRVVIDEGRAKTGIAVLPAFLARLPARRGRPDVDIMVLTHVDADQIEGLLSLLVGDFPLSVGDVWFNGRDHVAAARNSKLVLRPRNRRAAEQDDGSEVEVLSIVQGLKFGERVQARKWQWNSAFAHGPILIERDRPLPTVDLRPGGRLTLLGPTRAKLGAVAPEWANEFARMQEEETLAAPDRPDLQVERLALIATQMDKPDTAKPNGTSIAFVIEGCGRRVLFAADAHPDDLSKALARYSPQPGRVHFDAIKVAHHGSAKNNTSQLVDRLEAPLWLISTNGSRHRHPDPEALARMILAPLPGKTIAFNYRSEFNLVCERPALINAFGYATRYADAQPMTFEIDSRAPSLC
jgi:beta-lactamase superfamily II metal-dependent hydrolase